MSNDDRMQPRNTEAATWIEEFADRIKNKDERWWEDYEFWDGSAGWQSIQYLTSAVILAVQGFTLRRAPQRPATPKANSAADLLENAAVLIGTRGKQRDDGNSQERSMARTVETFNVMTGHQLTESDGWLFMRYLKDARARKGEFNRDDYDDGIAYAALQAEAAINENEEDT